MRVLHAVRGIGGAPAVRRLALGGTLGILGALAASTSGCDGKGGAKNPVPSAESLLARAGELGSKGFFTEGAKYLRSYADSVPPGDRGRVQLEVARLYERAGVYDLGLAAAEAAIALGVRDPDVYYLEAECQRQRRVPGAEATFEKLLQLAPDHLAGQLGLARIRLRSADPASALPLFESYFKKASPGDPDYRVALVEHARALRNSGRYQECADRYALLLEDDPLEGSYYSGLAEALYRLKLRGEARFVEDIYKVISQSAFEEHVEDRLREAGSTAFALGQRAVNRTRQRRFLEALQCYRQALEVDPADPRLRTYYADLCIHFRRRREARAVLEDAIQRGMQPASGLWWLLGRAALEEDDARRAFPAFRNGAAALEAEGDRGGEEKGQAPAFSLYLALARAAVEAGDLGAARAAVARAADLSPSSWEPLYWRGRIELAAGGAEKALALLAEASRRNPKGLMDLTYWTAIALAARGEKAEAIARLEQVVQSTPGYVPAYKDLLRVAEGDASIAGRVAEALARVEAIQAEVKAKERLIDATPLEDCGQHYLDLGKLSLKLKDPAAFDFLFLTTDLLPRSAEACQLILSGMKQPQDVFVRLRLLRRLLDLDPGDTTALRVIADTYLRLHVRIDEAARLAERLHAAGPSAASWRLRGLAALLGGDRQRAREVFAAGLAAYRQDPELREAAARAEEAASSPSRR